MKDKATQSDDDKSRKEGCRNMNLGKPQENSTNMDKDNQSDNTKTQSVELPEEWFDDWSMTSNSNSDKLPLSGDDNDKIHIDKANDTLPDEWFSSQM